MSKSNSILKEIMLMRLNEISHKSYFWNCTQASKHLFDRHFSSNLFEFETKGDFEP